MHSCSVVTWRQKSATFVKLSHVFLKTKYSIQHYTGYLCAASVFRNCMLDVRMRWTCHKGYQTGTVFH